jgi:hypothetical protein
MYEFDLKSNDVVNNILSRFCVNFCHNLYSSLQIRHLVKTVYPIKNKSYRLCVYMYYVPNRVLPTLRTREATTKYSNFSQHLIQVSNIVLHFITILCKT